MIIQVHNKRWSVQQITAPAKDPFTACQKCPAYVMGVACSDALVIKNGGKQRTLSDLCDSNVGFEILREIKEDPVAASKAAAKARQ